MAIILKKIKALEREIDDYLDLVVRGALLFKQGIKYFLEERAEEFTRCLAEIDKTEHDADALRRSIESKLYLETLIPDSRGDVLGILESTDRALNLTAETLQQFDMELPFILPETKSWYVDLTEASMSALETMVTAVRAYFRDLSAVRDHINKVLFYESQSDAIAEKLIRFVYRTGEDLSRKNHMRYFARQIEKIADQAEDVCDRLAIAAIKRHV